MWENILEGNSEEKEDELMIILQNFREKQNDLKQMRSYYATWWKRITKWRDSMWRDWV